MLEQRGSPAMQGGGWRPRGASRLSPQAAAPEEPGKSRASWRQWPHQAQAGEAPGEEAGPERSQEMGSMRTGRVSTAQPKHIHCFRCPVEALVLGFTTWWAPRFTNPESH